MTRYDALIVGGGPAGSTCARVLVQAGWTVGVLDRAAFPRDKVCAGWITPRVLDTVGATPAEYRAAGLTLQDITGFRTGVLHGCVVETRYRDVVSYAIRRCEFDDFLLQRTGARVHERTPARAISKRGQVWTVNDTFAAPVLVGAGGHFCPVARALAGCSKPIAPIVAREAEFCADTSSVSASADIPELFFCRDLAGYGWCMRKGHFLNVGIGRRDSTGFGAHFRDFVTFLEQSRRIVDASSIRWRGHAYYASGAGLRPLVSDGAMLIGDAAGLAFPESGEGIGPAVDSGRLAAQTLIAADGRYSRERLGPYAEQTTLLHPQPKALPPWTRSPLAALGRLLLECPAFTRHVMLDRWFLRPA
jgi:geranylgeranyl reductase family protein